MATSAITAKPKVSLDDFRLGVKISQAAQKVREESKVSSGTKSALDAFNNVAARLGAGTSNLLEGTRYPLTRLSYDWYLLIALYRNNWIASKLIDCIAEDMTKNWVNFPTELPPAKVKKLEQAVVATGTQDKILTTLKWARLFGGAAAVMIIKGQKLDEPLDLDDVPLDSYRGLIALDRWSGITPSAGINTDLERPLDYGLPETYRISGEKGSGVEVHSSRILRFTGRTMPAWEFQADQRWGVSEIERVFEELRKRDNTSFNLASLIFRANIFELRSKNLASMISGLTASTQAQQAFFSALEAQTSLMSNQGIIVSDADSGGLSTHQYGFSGISDVYMQFMLDICGACEIPFSRLFGRGASGLGQTGEGDEHAYYDMIAQKQKRELDPQMHKLMPVIAMSTWGKVPPDLEWKWNPVNSPSDKEKSELGAQNTTAIVEAFNAGIISQRTAGEELKQGSSVNGLFSNISDDDLEAMSDEAFGGEMQLAGMGGPGGGGDEGEGLDDKPGKKEKSLEKPKAKKKANDGFPHDLRHPGTGQFTRAPLQHTKFAGFPVVIENPVGSTRSGDGWSVVMKHPYGYISRTEGTDGDEVDVFLGPNEQAEKAYVVHTKSPQTGEYDEDKVFLGFNESDDAIAAFFDNYSDRSFMQSIETVFVKDLAAKLSTYRGRMIQAYDAFDRFLMDAEFIESEHPRDSDGKFTSGSGSSSNPLKWKNPAGRVANVYKGENGKWMYQTKQGTWMQLESAYAQAIEKEAYYTKPETKEKPEENKEENKEESTEGVEKELTQAEMKKKLYEPETHATILEAYKGGYSTGSIAKSMGLKQDKATRSAIRTLLRKSGVYKEKGAKAESGEEKVEVVSNKPVEQGKLVAMAHEFTKNLSYSGEYAFSNQDKAKTAFIGFCDKAGVKNGKEMLQKTIGHWTGSSHSKGAAIMKAIACEIYGKDIEFEPKLKYPVSDVKADAATVKEAFLAQKDFTQAWVQQHGAKKVHRGMRGAVVEEIKKQIAEGKNEIELTSNVLSSWSESSSKAKSFAGTGGVILKMDVKPENVWSCYGAMPFSSFNSFQSEKEYVMGLPGKTFKIRKEDISFV